MAVNVPMSTLTPNRGEMSKGQKDFNPAHSLDNQTILNFQYHH